METVTIDTYTFEELDDSAKDRAREWWRNGAEVWLDSEVEEIKRAGEMIGIQFDGTLEYSIGGSGDYAAWNGYYSYKAGSVQAVEAEYGVGGELARIARRLREAQRKAFYRATAYTRTPRGRYGSMTIETEHDWGYSASDTYAAQLEDVEDAIRSFEHWAQHLLTDSLEWQLSDEYVDDVLIANECTFTESGERI